MWLNNFYWLLAFLKTNFVRFLIIFMVFFSPIYWLLLLIGFSTFLDTVAGRWAAKKEAKRLGIHKRLYVTSKKTRLGFTTKTLFYLSITMILFVFDKYLLNDLLLYFLPAFPITYCITKFFGFALVAIEFDSVDEKYFRVYGVSIKDTIRIKLANFRRLIISAKDTKDGLNM